MACFIQLMLFFRLLSTMSTVVKPGLATTDAGSIPTLESLISSSSYINFHLRLQILIMISSQNSFLRHCCNYISSVLEQNVIIFFPNREWSTTRCFFFGNRVRNHITIAHRTHIKFPTLCQQTNGLYHFFVTYLKKITPQYGKKSNNELI